MRNLIKIPKVQKTRVPHGIVQKLDSPFFSKMCTRNFHLVMCEWVRHKCKVTKLNLLCAYMRILYIYIYIKQKSTPHDYMHFQ